MLVLCSGGFDPLHVGHVEYLRRASELGPVVVALNSDAWLIRKKGYVFQRFEERWEIVSALRFVDRCYRVDDSDGTVLEAIRELRPEVFAKGGDRGYENTPEVGLCEQLQIQLVFGLGGKVQASSGLVNQSRTVERQWGRYEVIYDAPGVKVKVLHVDPYKSTSVQSHDRRSEHWIWPDNRYRKIPPGERHWLANPGNEVMRVVEVQTGVCVEDDIKRY